MLSKELKVALVLAAVLSLEMGYVIFQNVQVKAALDKLNGTLGSFQDALRSVGVQV